MISDLTFEIVQNAILIFMIGMTSYQYDYIIWSIVISGGVFETTKENKNVFSGTGNRTRACWVRASYPNP